jgi:hypothetical protein
MINLSSMYVICQVHLKYSTIFYIKTWPTCVIIEINRIIYLRIADIMSNEKNCLSGQ